MSNFVDFTSGREVPISVDADAVTAIITCKGGHYEGDKMTFTVHDRNQGQLFYREMKDYDLGSQKILDDFGASGVTLFTLPYIWGDGKDVGHYHINPKDVQAIMVSDPLQGDDQNEPHVNLLADVRGYGRVETYGVPVSAVDAFVKEVEAVNDNLMRFESSEYSTRWYGDEGYTIVDTSQIRDIRPNGYDIDLYFYNRARVDFDLDRGGEGASEASSGYLNRLVKRIQGENGTREDLLKALGGSLDNLMPRLSRYENRYRKKLREEFAAAVADKAPQLHRIKEAKDVYYIDPHTVGMLVEQDDYLSVRFKKAASDQYPDMLGVWCNGEDAVRAAKENVITQISTKPI